MRGELVVDDALAIIAERTALPLDALHRYIELSCKNMAFLDPALPYLMQQIRATGTQIIIATDNMDTLDRRSSVGRSAYRVCYDGVMKLYVTSRYKGADRKSVEDLCAAARAAGMQDFSFIRDIEGYQKIFDNPQDLWRRSKEEIATCDALLVDVSDGPTGGRVIETGIAFGLDMPVLVAVKRGTPYKEIFDGVATMVIPYDSYQDLTAALSALPLLSRM